MARLVWQASRFLAVGVACAIADYSTYTALASAGPIAARAASFIVGTTLAYLLNRRLTFNEGARPGAGQPIAFAALYATTFLVAIIVNHEALRAVPAFVAWAASQAAATAINFVVLRTLVFSDRSAA